MSQSNDRVDQELATWFARRGVAWSGTATELLTSIRTGSDPSSSLWPQSPRGLYDHLQTHRGLLRALGVDVLLSQGIPRMVSLRPCPNEPNLTKQLLDTSEINLAPISPPDLLLPFESQSAASAIQSADAGSAPREKSGAENSVAKSDSAGRYVNTKYAVRNAFEARVFEDTGEALVAIGEMRRQIREQGFDFESVVNVVIGAALEITRCYRIVVGVHGTGGRITVSGLPVDADLFRSRLMEGESVQLPDAQKDPILGPKYRREGVGSLIIVPIFRDRVVAGSMEFLFRERRKFSDGDVMDLGLIAAVASESLGNVPLGDGKQSEGCELPEGTKAGEAIELEKVGDTSPFTTASLERPTPKSGLLQPPAAPSGPFWRVLRRVWRGNPRGK